MRFRIAVGFILLVYTYSCTTNSPTAQQSDSHPGASDLLAIDLVPIAEELRDGKSSFHIQQLSVENDFLFKGPKRYQAIALSDVIESNLGNDQTLTDFGSVKFVCKDGYEPAHRLADIPMGAGWLVFHDLEAPTGSLWEPEKAESYGPFYLVWEEEDLDRKSVSWPYGLVRIELSANDPHDAIAPTGDELALQGFRIYERRCIKCHTINKIGGHVGPELNYPKSITEYWEKETIWQYTKDPRSFRYNSQMHGTEDISREEFELLYRYLSYMKDREPS